MASAGLGITILKCLLTFPLLSHFHKCEWGIKSVFVAPEQPGSIFFESCSKSVIFFLITIFIEIQNSSLLWSCHFGDWVSGYSLSHFLSCILHSVSRTPTSDFLCSALCGIHLSQVGVSYSLLPQGQGQSPYWAQAHVTGVWIAGGFSMLHVFEKVPM